MKNTASMKRVMIFVSEADRYHHQNLTAALLDKLKKEGCGGATVFKGSAGFGMHGQIHTNTIVDLASNLPDCILFVESAEKTTHLLQIVEEMVEEGFITVDDVETIHLSKK